MVKGESKSNYRIFFPISDTYFRKVIQHLHYPCLVKEEGKYGVACPMTPLMYQVCSQRLAFYTRCDADPGPCFRHVRCPMH